MCEYVSMPLEHAHCALKKKKKKDAEDEKEQEKKSDQCTVTLVHSVLWCTPQTGAQCALCSGAHHRLVQELVNSVLCALMHTTDWCRDWCMVLRKGMHVD